MESILIDGREYISTKRATELTKYSKDYVGQLCRSKKVLARRVGRNWYADKLSHKDDALVTDIIKTKKDISSNKRDILKTKDETEKFESKTYTQKKANNGTNNIRYESDDSPLLPTLSKKTDIMREEIETNQVKPNKNQSQGIFMDNFVFIALLLIIMFPAFMVFSRNTSTSLVDNDTLVITGLLVATEEKAFLDNFSIVAKELYTTMSATFDI
jgi:hypothetical protein